MLEWHWETRGDYAPEYWKRLSDHRIRYDTSGVYHLLCTHGLFAIGRTVDGKFALLTQEWVHCTPLYFDTLDAAKAAAELLVSTYED